ncbi:hypothetical protein EON63_05045 [archaeon]|nr:MAG: hypothetical protein EON63_05045 [archaeon]
MKTTQCCKQVVSKDDKPYVEVLIEGKPRQFAPEEVSAMILSKMKVRDCLVYHMT